MALSFLPASRPAEHGYPRRRSGPALNVCQCATLIVADSDAAFGHADTAVWILFAVAIVAAMFVGWGEWHL